MSRLKSLGALVVAPLTCLLVLACDTGQESSVTAPNPSFNVVGNPVEASASGSGHFVTIRGGPRRTFSFTAQRQYDGTVHGRFQLNAFTSARFQGTVTCITVEGDGKTARIGGIVTSGTAFIGLDVAFTVVDNSEGPQSPVDQITLVRFSSSGPGAAFHCAIGFPPSDFGGLNNIQRGNIQVNGANFTG